MTAPRHPGPQQQKQAPDALDVQAQAWVRRLASGAARPRDARALKHWCGISEAPAQAFQKAHGLAQTGVADTKVWQALENRDYPLRAYYGTVLKVGAKGAAVTVLQKALGVKADGVFGASTTTAVKALQGRAKLASTGVVATLTWQALEAELRRRQS